MQRPEVNPNVEGDLWQKWDAEKGEWSHGEWSHGEWSHGESNPDLLNAIQPSSR
jgi:hypothetical protein